MRRPGTLIPRFSADDAVRLAHAHFGLTVRARRLASYLDQNFRLEDASGRELVLKISNGEETLPNLDLQHRMMEALERTFDADAVPRVVPAATGEEVVRIRGRGGVRHYLRLVTFLPGIFLADVTPHTAGLLSSLGTFLGTLDRTLAGFSHPAMNRAYRWNMTGAAAVIRAHAPHIASPEDRALVDHFLAQLETHLPPVEPQLRRSVIHNDANDNNVLVGHTRSGRQRVTGLIDFGDTVYSYTVAEVAIAAAYVMLGKADPLEAAAQVVGGYHAAHPLTDPELVALFDLICARLATSVSISAHDKKTDPGNRYLTVSEASAWELLRKLVWVSRGHAYDTFRKACRMSSPTPSVDDIVPVGDLSPEEILDKRRRYLGRSLSVSYAEPLKIVRGFMEYLYDEDGRAYLDCVNNVCHVGHCHPRVVKAAQDQMAVLNTNTRYLHGNLVRYAERLAKSFPDPLGVCYFVCSGSEANDLALRLARAHTGGSDCIVVDGAYHGNLSSLIDLSPYKFDGPGGAGAPKWVHKVATPDVYRGPYKASVPEAGRRYAEHVAEAVETVKRKRRRLAAFFCESMLGCGGQIVLPDGYLAEASRHVRAAGGVVVVDEVQVGFGRVGSHFWAFETQDVVPDIVTLGKPIGNGHPLAAVVTTPEVAASFTNGMEYFNTFGGNPVSCAIGLAVLDAIEDDRLQENARRVGSHFLAGLGRLKERHRLVGDVRGRGLFLGVELVRDRETLEPAAAEAKALVEAMKERGILLSTDGPLANVIKIKPPLVFSMADADRVVEALDVALAEL